MFIIFTDEIRPETLQHSEVAKKKKFNSFISDKVEKDKSFTNKEIEQAASDLLKARINHIYATNSRIITEVTPQDGDIYYEINIGNIPNHGDTLGRDHIYKYQLED